MLTNKETVSSLSNTKGGIVWAFAIASGSALWAGFHFSIITNETRSGCR